MTVGINSIIRDGVCTKYETERRLAALREKHKTRWITRIVIPPAIRYSRENLHN